MALASTVAVDPYLSRWVASTNGAAAQHLDNYGSVSHRIYWEESVAGSNTAFLRDCMDQSQFGAINTVTHKKVTVGPARVKYRATYERSGGAWRVGAITVFAEDKC